MAPRFGSAPPRASHRHRHGNAECRVVQLASVPLSIGTISPASGPASGGTILTLRGSGFQPGATVTIGGKSAAITFVDINTLTVTTPPLTAGPQQILVTNPDGDSYAFDDAFTAN